MPSGSDDLRLLWLETDIHIGDRTVNVPAVSRHETAPYDVAGEGTFDKEILSGEIP